MDIFLGLNLWDIFMNLDVYLSNLINNYGSIAFLIIFLIVFCETGLVVTPFLPGDSMIFILGALGASGQINLLGIGSVIIAAAILGNMLNYQIGRFVGPRVFERENNRFFKQEHLLRTHAFFEKHGGKTIVLARFIPIIRTFAPFVAGIGQMEYGRFSMYNIIGSVSWVLACLAAGYLFGNIPVVEKNFTLIIVAIIIISLVPAIVITLRQKTVTQNQTSD
ncbi:SNARE associated Golgi protein [Syntrophomonas zehnderi OL-4]|uniref:SNARE associated Golgi protein n=1 Tax=Syntrophomonas zehnderi OL-4 TaxID=690567 RepID=A0A0E4GCA2_9FIRM|nr:DedA family protein [Syntrophomonas zehnderi]CFY08438.1 SNARE associated Golgi protein [Syntrophomonas zehnderi OL-4]